MKQTGLYQHYALPIVKMNTHPVKLMLPSINDLEQNAAPLIIFVLNKRISLEDVIEN